MVKSRKNNLILSAVLLGVLILAWLFATYVPLRLEKTRYGETLYITEKNLWNTPIRRTVEMESGSFMCGPVSETGKKHGEWLYANEDNSYTERLWYWYGEEISEGKWHELNN